VAYLAEYDALPEVVTAAAQPDCGRRRLCRIALSAVADQLDGSVVVSARRPKRALAAKSRCWRKVFAGVDVR